MNGKEKLIKCYEKGYRIDKEGKIWYKNKNVKGFILHKSNIPYLTFSVKIEGTPYNILAHRLQAYQK